MWWKKTKKESTHNLIFVFPGKQGKVHLTHAEWILMKNLAEKRDISFEEVALLLIRMSINTIIDIAIDKEKIIIQEGYNPDFTE